ncbi:low molecular weight phosphatase family protein [Mycobacterium sp. PS03-16]|nr:low molecular weight phosphatase family protein [Mycobacterium sp. PS03-16]
MHILFVCTGNLCRSPIAERLARAYLRQMSGSADVTVSSAGTRAVVSQPMHPYAALVLQRLGGDSADFYARQFTPPMSQDVDLVLTMTRAHRDQVLERAPYQVRRTFTLGEAARLMSDFTVGDIRDLAALRPNIDTRNIPDIPDPIGQDLEFFASVGCQIRDSLPPILKFCGRG